MGILCVPYWLCSEGDELWLITSLLEHCWVTLLLRVIASPSGQMVWKMFSTVGGAVIQLLAWVWVNQYLGPAKLLVWGSTLGRSSSCQVPWPVLPRLGSANEQSLWLGSPLGLFRYVLSLPRSVCWLLQAPPPFSVTIRFLVVEPHRFLWSPHDAVMQDQSRVSRKAIHSSGVAGFHPWVLFFHWRNSRLREDFSAWCCTGLGEGQRGECVAASLSLSVKPVLVSVVQGDASASPLCSRIFSVVSFSWLVVTCSSYEG